VGWQWDGTGMALGWQWDGIGKAVDREEWRGERCHID